MAHRTGGSDFTRAFEEAQRMVPKDLATALRADRAFSRLPWEALPSEALNSPEVWRALLDNDSVPLGALMRQLPRLTKLGVLGGVAERLTDAEAIKRARLHPLALLVALKTYASGHGLKGSLTWTPVHRICDVLDEAFYLSFDAVEPTGRRTLLALDISGSMGYDSIAGLPITPREASAALAMVTAKSEREYEIVGFTAKSADSFGWNTGAELTPLDVSPRRRLDDNLCAISGLPMGATDCALPMVWAKEHGKEFDSFEILTDNETFAGDIKPTQALAEYRRASGIDARLAVVGMTSSGFSIADPTDVGQLDVVGFDTSTPNVISDFFRG
jgi:60 kDa SS-A/Ro ribonucleoprotein